MDVITLSINLLTTSGLSILLRSIILLPDATSYDQGYFNNYMHRLETETEVNRHEHLRQH